MNIIVTGCGHGIGYEVVALFLKDPNNKVVGISRSKENLDILSASVENTNFKGIQYDLTEIHKSGPEVVSEILNYLGHIDILINNAGNLISGDFNKSNFMEIEKLFMTNVFAPAELIRLLYSHMGGKSFTHIVNIGSMGGFQGSLKFNGLAWYSASKASIACLSECLADEFKGKNIVVNCLALGAVQTDMLAKAFPGYNAPIQPADMATYIANFALTAYKFINGKIIPVALSNP